MKEEEIGIKEVLEALLKAAADCSGERSFPPLCLSSAILERLIGLAYDRPPKGPTRLNVIPGRPFRQANLRLGLPAICYDKAGLLDQQAADLH